MNKQLSKEETKHEDEAKLVVGRVMAGEEDTWIDDSLGHFGVSDVGKGWPPNTRHYTPFMKMFMALLL